MLDDSLGGKAAAAEQAGIMSKQMMSVRDAALLLIESADKVATEEEFEQLAEAVLEDNSPGEIQAIAAHMPPALRQLMPKRTLH